MVGYLYLVICLIPIIYVHCDKPSVRKSESNQNFWSISRNHPLTKELDLNLGVPIRTVEDFHISSLRQGDFNKLLPKDFSSSSPEIFSRKQRSTSGPQCNIQIQMYVTRPGQCIRLRDNIPACQDEDYVAINYDECS